MDRSKLTITMPIYEFEDYAHNTDYCRKVFDKWVFVIA